MNIPKAFVRPDDGIVFSINEDGKTYSLKKSKEEFPDAYHHQYSLEKLKEVDFIPIF